MSLETKKKPSSLSQKFFLIAALVVNLSSISHSQKFLLTDINSTQFSIDRVGQHVYFKDFYTDSVRKIDLKTLGVTNTGFLVSLPVFSNIKHLMLFGDNSPYDHGNKNTFYLYDFNTHSKLILTDIVAYPDGVEHIYSFSPRDSNFYHIAGSYFSLKDSTLLPLAKNVKLNLSTMDAYPQWSSDSSLVFLSSTDVIVEYYLYSKRLDTLVTFANINGFAYNTKHNILAYSTTEHPPQIYFHYKNSNKDSLIFSPSRDDPNSTCWQMGYYGFTSLCWSPDNKKLAFIAFQYIDASDAGIYLYSLDSNRTYTAAPCYDGGLKYHMKWANNDTLIYVNTTDKHIYGMDVSSVITSIENTKEDRMPTDFSISNYPNPFNPETTINYTLPESGNIQVKIFDVLGRELKTLVNEFSASGSHSVKWDGSNYSSGIYFCSITFKGKTLNNKMLMMK